MVTDEDTKSDHRLCIATKDDCKSHKATKVRAP